VVYLIYDCPYSSLSPPFPSSFMHLFREFLRYLRARWKFPRHTEVFLKCFIALDPFCCWSLTSRFRPATPFSRARLRSQANFFHIFSRDSSVRSLESNQHLIYIIYTSLSRPPHSPPHMSPPQFRRLNAPSRKGVNCVQLKSRLWFLRTHLNSPYGGSLYDIAPFSSSFSGIFFGG